MTYIPAWHAKGDWFDVCRCNVPCPCSWAEPPDDDYCEGILVWHIREGRFGDVPLDGLNVVGVSTFKGNVWAGSHSEPRLGVLFDDRADDRQRQAIWWTGRRLARPFRQNLRPGDGWPRVRADYSGNRERPEFLACRDRGPRTRGGQRAVGPDKRRQATTDGEPSGRGDRTRTDRHARQGHDRRGRCLHLQVETCRQVEQVHHI